jgi:sulfane dehydrogenase subunit SoxC
MSEPTDIGKGLAVTSRRRFLREGGALVGGAVVAGSLGGSKASAAMENSENLPPNVPEWMKTPGDPMGSQLYGTPSPFEKKCRQEHPEEPDAIFVGIRANAAAGPRRHNHSEWIVL